MGDAVVARWPAFSLHGCGQRPAGRGEDGARPWCWPRSRLPAGTVGTVGSVAAPAPDPDPWPAQPPCLARGPGREEGPLLGPPPRSGPGPGGGWRLPRWVGGWPPVPVLGVAPLQAEFQTRVGDNGPVPMDTGGRHQQDEWGTGEPGASKRVPGAAPVCRAASIRVLGAPCRWAAPPQDGISPHVNRSFHRGSRRRKLDLRLSCRHK